MIFAISFLAAALHAAEAGPAAAAVSASSAAVAAPAIATAAAAGSPETVVAQPPAWYRPAHGVHLTGWGAGSAKTRRALLRQLRAAALNTVVIALKEYDGYMFVRDVPLARATGAYVNAIPDLPGCVREFKAAGIYTIARIVLFKDNHLARHRPDLAVHTPGGGIWANAKGVAWVDPYRREVLCKTSDGRYETKVRILNEESGEVRIVPGGTGRSRSDEARASAIGRSSAGSSTVSPPATFT